jgi:hypothetical protein
MVLFAGLEVIAQVPDSHPTLSQYNTNYSTQYCTKNGELIVFKPLLHS